jgi:hypothetical protein
MQGLNVSAHEGSLTADSPSPTRFVLIHHDEGYGVTSSADENGFSFPSTFQPLNNSTSAVAVLRIAIFSSARNHEVRSAVIQFPNM